MDKYIAGFSEELTNLIFLVYELMPTTEVEHIINIFPKLNKLKLVDKFNANVLRFKSNIHQRDTSIFNAPLYIIPEFNMSKFWPNIPDTRKDEIWKMLTKLTIYASIINSMPNNDATPHAEKKCDNKNTKEINPYFGIKADPNGVSVNSMIDEIKKGETSGNPLVNMLKEKLNDPEIVDKLKNIDDAELSTIKSDIKNMMSPCISDPKISNLIDNMLCNISAELKGNDITNGNIFDNMVKIAEKMSKNVASDGSIKSIDPDVLLKSTQMMLNNMGLENIQSQLPPGLDPSMLMGLLNVRRT